MNLKLYEFLAIVMLFLGTTVGAFYYGMDYGRAVTKVQQDKVAQAIADAKQASMEGAASEISKIQIHNTTVQGRVETVVRDNPVYRDCKHDDDALRLLNSALTGGNGTKPAGDRSMPAADSAR